MKTFKQFMKEANAGWSSLKGIAKQDLEDAKTALRKKHIAFNTYPPKYWTKHGRKVVIGVDRNDLKDATRALQKANIPTYNEGGIVLDTDQNLHESINDYVTVDEALYESLLQEMPSFGATAETQEFLKSKHGSNFFKLVQTNQRRAINLALDFFSKRSNKQKLAFDALDFVKKYLTGK